MAKTDADTGRLEEIQHEMLELLDEASRIVRAAGGGHYERARGYWLAHIESALHRDHGYLGGSVVTMEDTIREIGDGDDEE